MSHENDDALSRPSLNGSGAMPIPPSRLPDLLQHLGLDRLQERGPELHTLLTDLKDPVWYKRAAALRELGKLGAQAPLEDLLLALEDAHVSVRANAVQALGQLGARVPVERLTEVLLRDSEWQVRESAAFALETLGMHAPAEPLLNALHDPDMSVRHAVQHALEQTHPELLNPNSLVGQEQPASTQSAPAFPQNRPGIRSLLEYGKSVHRRIYEKEGSMSDNNFSAETISYTDGKRHELEPPRQRKRKTWRVVSLSIAAAVVIINLLAWSILTHALRGPKTGTTQIGSQVSSPTTASTPSVTPGQTGPLGKTLFVYPPAGKPSNDDFMSVGWSADGKYISLSEFGTTLFDASNGKIVKTLGSTSGSAWASWSPDGKHLALSSGSVQVWDVQTGQVLTTYTPKGAPVAGLAPHGSALISLSGGNMVYNSAWSADGKLIASAVNGNAYGYNVQIWNASTGAPVRTLQIKANATATDYISDVGWSPDGKYIAANSPNDGVFVWEAATGKRVYTHAGAARMVWSPQGDVIASADQNGLVQVWQATTGTVQLSFQGNAISSLAWAPNGQYLAAGGQDVRIWDVAQNKLHYTYTGHGKHKDYFTINGLAWSPDSIRVVSMGVGMDVTAPHTGISLDAIRVWVAV